MDYSHTGDERQIDFWRAFAQDLSSQLEDVRGELDEIRNIIHAHARGRIHDHRVKGYTVSHHDLDLWRKFIPEKYNELVAELFDGDPVRRKYDGSEYDIRF